MDAYSSYIKQLSDARLGELRREADDYRMSATARKERRAQWAARFRRVLIRPRPEVPAGLPQAWANSSKPSSR